MLSLDHLTVIAPSLAEGVEHVRACLGVDMPYGGTHPEMGTHNHVLRLGDDAYLEVIAIDPDAPPPAGPIWFGLGDPQAVRSRWIDGARLSGWVARTGDIDAVLAAHGALLGTRIHVSRAGSHSAFSMPPDGSLPQGGVLPSVIERVGGSAPAVRMSDLGCRLSGFVLEHPRPTMVAELYDNLEIRNPSQLRERPKVRIFATIDTPLGVGTLT